MQTRCYFCDTELTESGHAYRVGAREEQICEECYVKMVNRRKALNEPSA